MNRSIKAHKEMLGWVCPHSSSWSCWECSGRGAGISLEVSNSKRLINLRRKAESRAWLRGTAAGMAVTCPLIF